MILGALNRNTSSASGAEALVGALQRDHDGSILNDVSQALTAPETMDDGTAILGHVMGDRRGVGAEGIHSWLRSYWGRLARCSARRASMRRAYPPCYRNNERRR